MEMIELYHLWPELREKNRYKLVDYPMKPQDDEVWKPSKKIPQYDAGGFLQGVTYGWYV